MPEEMVSLSLVEGLTKHLQSVVDSVSVTATVPHTLSIGMNSNKSYTVAFQKLQQVPSSSSIFCDS